MNYSFDKLRTLKFKQLRDEPEEFLRSLSVLAAKHGLDVAIKQIKRANIVVSRNKEQRYEQLFNDSLKLLAKKFPTNYRLIKQFKYEATLFKKIYQNIFSRVPKIEDKIASAREKTAFLIYLENYLMVNRHLEVSTSDKLNNYLIYPNIKIDMDALHMITGYEYYIEEQTRETRDILLYFNTIKTDSLEDIELSRSEIFAQKKYIDLINDFWIFEHIHELWAYLDMPLYMKNNILNIDVLNQKTYKAWMVANYRSRHTFDWRMCCHSAR